MYRTSKNTESIESIIGDTWDIHSNEQVFGVRKLVLCASGPRAILLKIDCVNAENDLPLGTDLWAYIHVSYENGRFAYGKFQASGPSVQLTLCNALRYGRRKINCYVLRRDIMPKYGLENKFVCDESTVDGRFRGKLNLRREYCTLVPAWEPTPVRVIIKPGKNKDDYWNNEQMIQQTIDAIDAFESMAPKAVGIFCYDNSSGHRAFASDALNANSLLVGDISWAKEVPQPSRNSWYLRVRDGKRIEQLMNSNTENGLQRKGMETILKERGLWKQGLVGDCKLCSEELKRGFVGVIDVSRNACCMGRIISLQPDFKEQKSQLEELIVSRGHVCLFFPKFHCELNFIELFWAQVKYLIREKCEYNLASLLTAIPETMDALSRDLPLPQRLQRHTFRYVDAYSKGMTGRLAIYVVKKYRGHRTIPDSWRTALTAGYNNTFSMRIFQTACCRCPSPLRPRIRRSAATWPHHLLLRILRAFSAEWCLFLSKGSVSPGRRPSRYSECRIRGRVLKVLAGKECKVKNKVSSPYLFHLICDAEYTKSLTEKQIDQWLVPADAEVSTSNSRTLEELNMNDDE